MQTLATVPSRRRGARFLAFGMLAAFVFAGCATADLRPDEFDAAESAADRDRGRALLNQMAAAHGGEREFKKSGVYRARVHDDWSPTSFPFTLLKPFPGKVQKYDMYQRAGTEDTRLVFLNGKLAGQEWGVQQWETYTVKDGGEPRFKDNATIRFTGPAIGYFVQAPFRLPEATYVQSLGRLEHAGRSYERVFATWETPEPHKQIDQFVAWIDAETSRLRFLEWTARQQAKFVSGWMSFEDYKQVDGFWFAHKMTTVTEPGGKPNFHVVHLAELELGTQTSPEFLIPEPSRSRGKF